MDSASLIRFAWLLSVAVLADPQRIAMPGPVSYTLRFPAPASHYTEVEAVFPATGRAELELMMAVWTPGSYLLREYAGNLEEISARTADGSPLAITKTKKNRWRVATGGAAEVHVHYRLYCREMSVRTNFVDADFALLNGAATFLTPVEEGVEEGAGEGAAEVRRRPHQVTVEPAAGWRTTVSALPPAPGGGEHRYLAASFDELVDSPIYAGSPALYRFDVGGVDHLLVNEGEGGIWDGERAARDTERIVRQQQAFWGDVPYPRYVFFNLITEGRGGLEHQGSSVLMTSRWKARSRDGYLGWLHLVSHELFHAWNGKRLRPAALGPFDYESEVYTRDLWVVEGITSYYDDLLVHRAGLSNRKEFLKSQSEAIERLATTPGREVQALADSSFDAWIKFYRRNENSVNSTVSYYNKGELVAWLLDVEIRRATGDDASLDDVLRLAFRRHSGARGFTSAQFRAAAEEVARTDLGDFFHRTVATTDPVDFRPALDWFGLELATKDDKDDEPRGPDGEPVERAWLGAETEVRDGRLLVTEVRRDTPAAAAGLNVDDEILAVAGYRVPPGGLGERLQAFRPGQTAELLVARRERLLPLTVTFGPKPEERFRLVVSPRADEAQRRHLDSWLGVATRVPAGAAR